MYNVISKLSLNGNTAVTIDGDGREFKNGVYIKTDKNVIYYVISVGLTRKEIDKNNPTTELFIDGDFKGDKIYLV